MSLPYDYSRCAASQCAIKHTCARFMSPSRPDGPQAFNDFSLGETCGEFIAIRPTASQESAQSIKKE